jgi:hypothetical protein
MSSKLAIEKAVLELVARQLANGIGGDDPRQNGAGFSLYPDGIDVCQGKPFLKTTAINDEGEYFELSCLMRRK